MVSWTDGMGKVSFLVISFRRRQSMHQRIFPPFFLAATRLNDQGLLAGSMTSWRSHSSSWRRKSGSRAGFTGRYLHLMGGTSSVMMRCCSKWVCP